MQQTKKKIIRSVAIFFVKVLILQWNLMYSTFLEVHLDLLDVMYATTWKLQVIFRLVMLLKPKNPL